MISVLSSVLCFPHPSQSSHVYRSSELDHTRHPYQGYADTPPKIEHLSQISAIEPLASVGYEFTLAKAGPILDDCKLGDSIQLNGACLTVTQFDAEQGWFKVGLAPETLSRTNLGDLKVGDWVNCERAMAGHARFGGHFVQVSGLNPESKELVVHPSNRPACCQFNSARCSATAH
jgi:hypothetical protein